MKTEVVAQPKGKRSQAKKAAAIAAFLWMLAVFTGYYAVHKPISAQEINGMEKLGNLLISGLSGSGIVSSSWAAFVAGWMLLVAYLLGGFVLRRFFFSCISSSWDYVTFGAPLGLGLISIAIFAVGMLGVLYTWALVLMLATATITLVRPSGVSCVKYAFRSVGDYAKTWDRWTRLSAAFVALSMFAALPSALAPPTAWDALVYHLFQGKLYVNAHRIMSGLDITYFYFPSLTESLFTGAMLLKSETAPALISFGLCALTLLSVYRYSDKVFAGNWGLIAVSLLVSSPSLMYLAGKPYVEWGLLLFIFLAFWQMEQWADERSSGRLVLSGVYAGFAMSIKYTAAPMIMGLGILCLWHSWNMKLEDIKRTKPRISSGTPLSAALPRLIAPSAIWSLVALAVTSPWFVKNLLFTGNPFYPFVFGGRNWDAWRTEWFSRPGTGLLGEPIRLLALPWEATVLGQEGTSYFDATIGLLYLCLLPLLLLVGWNGRVKTWVFMAVVGYIAWALGIAQSYFLLQTRLLYPVFPFLALIATQVLAGLKNWEHGPFDIGWVTSRLVGVAMTLTAIGYLVHFISNPSIPYLTGAQSREEYLGSSLGGYYSAMEAAASTLSDNDKLLLLWEPRGYMCPAECQPDPLLDNWMYALHKYGGPDAVLKSWQAKGYTHVLLNNYGVAYFSTPSHPDLEPEHLAALREIERKGLERVWGLGLESIGTGNSDSSTGLTTVNVADYYYTLYTVKY